MTISLEKQLSWLYSLKKKILVGLLSILTISIGLTMFFIAFMLRNSMLDDSKFKTEELSNAIQSSLGSLMLTRDPDVMQSTIENIGKSNHSIVRAFIIDKKGRVVYSSDRNDIGRMMDKLNEKSCQVCHQTKGVVPHEETIIIKDKGSELYRNIKVIFNQESCHGCHPASDRINGKLIIDRSLKGTYSLIASIELLILASGFICLIILVPFLSKILSKGLNTYIEEIVHQNIELRMLYVMIERLSKTIDLDELKAIVIEIMKEALSPDEIDIIFYKGPKEYRNTSWSKAKDKITRKKIEKDDPLSSIIGNWLDGKLGAEEISKDGKLIYLPIKKSDKNLALIIIRKTDEAFAQVRLGLLKIMTSHISVAFENALLYLIAITDELTGLYTPRYYRSYIDNKFADFEKYGEKLTLLMIDIDDFKKVNDRYGHMTGDSVLKDVSERILFSIRDNDLAFRYGGEEFVVILPSTDIAGARHVAERMRENIAENIFEKGSLDLNITVSIGVSVCPDNANNAKDLMLTADQALYKAKKTGKNRVVISENHPA